MITPLPPALPPSLAVTVFTLSPTFVSESSVLLEEDTDDWIDTGNVVGPNGFPAAPPVNPEAAAPSSGADAGSASPALSPAESDGESDGESLAESNGKSGGESDCGGERRSGRRASLLPGGYEDRGVCAPHKRRTRGRKQHRPSKRTRDHKRNELTYLKRTAARRAAFIDLAKKGIEKIDAARRAWEEGATDWGAPILVDPAQLRSVTKNRALTLRMMVVRAYLGLLVQSENTQRLKHQIEVGGQHQVSPALVASWTRTFLWLEPLFEPPGPLPEGSATAQPQAPLLPGGVGGAARPACSSARGLVGHPAPPP